MHVVFMVPLILRCLRSHNRSFEDTSAHVRLVSVSHCVTAALFDN